MSRIAELDKNFARPEEKGGLIWADAHALPCEITGLHPGTFCRVDSALLPQLPAPVQELAHHTAGGMVRFHAQAGRYGYRYTLRSGEDMSHMPRTGSAGLDVYLGSGQGMRFLRSTRPECRATAASGEFTLAQEEEVTLYLPLYNGVRRLELGFEPGRMMTAPAQRRFSKPIVFYGSSITQGGCASRPGNTNAAMLCRCFDCPQHNLGFSGNGKGEIGIARYIASLPMTALVMDYDHNAPSAEHLERTHLPFVQAILASQPDLPVLIATRPDFSNGDPADNAARREAVRRSYETLKAQGASCAFIDGETLFDGPFSDNCTVDGCHPNDLGFYRMAMKMLPPLRRLILGEETA